MVWCYFIRQKLVKYVVDIFKSFKVLVEKHSGNSILHFRCDNGHGEYDNRLFPEYLVSEGIIYEPSAPYTQHQNGISEWIIRTIMERARTILLELQLNDSFWAEAVNTAVYLHNHSPTRALQDSTPYQAWHGLQPPLRHLRKFGCDVYVYVPDQCRKKLDAKLRRCIHLGYVHNTTKVWRLWDIATRRVIPATDVIFDETSLGGRTPYCSLHPLSTLLIVKLDNTVGSDTPAVSNSETNQSQGQTASNYTTLSEVDDTAGGKVLFVLEDRVGNSDEPMPSTQHDDSPMAMGMSMEMSITPNGMAPGEEEPTTSNRAAPDGNHLPALRKSTRARGPSFWLRDSVTFAARASKHAESQSYQEALEQADFRKWEIAMREEFRSHLDNET